MSGELGAVCGYRNVERMAHAAAKSEEMGACSGH